MKKSQKNQHLTLIQDDKKLPLKPDRSKNPRADIKITRIADWNKRLETLLSKQRG